VIDFTRRKVLGVAAGTMATAMGAAQLTEPAVADDAADLDLFVKLSPALTGIDVLLLAPLRDPLQIKRIYQNLFLVGSGTFPTVGTANPTLTIAALCLRTADYILRRVLN
jgi:hypothetical protein